MHHLIVETAPYAEVWNRAAAPHPVTYGLIEEVTAGDPSFLHGDILTEYDGLRLAAFAVAKRLRKDYLGCGRFRDDGYIPLLAVDPDYQGRGLGSRLLERAETFLRGEGATRVVLGGSFHHALAGIPDSLPWAREFFGRRGYEVGSKRVWDVQRDVRHLDVPSRVGEDLAAAGVEGRIVVTRFGTSADPEATAALLEFLHAEFPGRWCRDIAHSFCRPESAAHVMTLWQSGGGCGSGGGGRGSAIGVGGTGGGRVVGFAQIHLPETPGTLRWEGFDPDAAAIGPVGVAKDMQGRGLGLAVVALAADFLKRRGARRVVIDWTDLVDFYGRLGFEPWLSYVLAHKTL